MDKYHIHEEIGKGEFSQVYKARQRNTIEYVAVKRSEKRVMKSIVNEVQILHKLNCPHIMRFYDWYETRNNIWLVVEYCTGGDLASLIRQDKYLPEASVRMFGLDILAGLKYVHSAGMVYCDLQPRNILIDEHGILKLSDFKFARKIPKSPLGDSPLNSRGSPPYMAPELFASEGVHSFASDFWSLGCVLYELRRGIAPFGDDNMPLQEMIDKIRTSEPVEFPTVSRNMDDDDGDQQERRTPNRRGRSAPEPEVMESIPPVSTELADLLLWLLEKAPMNRCSWEELAPHPFWGEDTVTAPNAVPPQAAYDNLIRNLERARSHQIEMASLLEFGVVLDGSFHTSSGDNPNGMKALLPPAVGNTPVRSMGSSSSKTAHQQQVQHAQLATSGTQGQGPVDPNSSSKNQISINYMVSTGTNLMSQLNNATTNSNTAGNSNNSSNMITPTKTPMPRQAATEDIVKKPQQSTPKTNQSTGTGRAADAGSAAAAGTGTGMVTPVKGIAEQLSSQAITPSSTRTNAITGAARSAAAAGTAAAPAATRAGAVSSGLSAGLTAATPKFTRRAENTILELMGHNLISHQSDTLAKPIIGNKAIEVIEKFPIKPAAFQNHFPPLSAEEVSAMPTQELESHITLVYRSILRCTLPPNNVNGGSSSNSNSAASASGVLSTIQALTERGNLFAYLFSISTVPTAATIVLNTPFIQLVLRSIRQLPSNLPILASNSSTAQQNNINLLTALNNCRIVATSTLAMCIRYATCVNPPLPKSREDHIIPCLISLLNSNNNNNNSAIKKLDPKLKRRAIAALGELLFFIASQDGTDEEDATVSEGGKWEFPSEVVVALLQGLRDDSDEIVRHYSAKAIENILAQGSLASQVKLLVPDIANRLLELSQLSGNDSLQATCGMAVSRMFQLVMTLIPPPASPNPPTNQLSARNASAMTAFGTIFNAGCGGKFIAKVLERGGLTGIIENLRDGPSKLQQSYLNIINIIMCPNYFESSTQLSFANGSLVPIQADSLSYTGSNTPDGIALKPIRAFLLTNAGLLPALQRLVEQGSTSATRAKALLACQFLCIHNPSLLAQLAEKRLTYVLMRTLEPLLTFQDSGAVGGGVGGNNTSDLDGSNNNDSNLSHIVGPTAMSYSVKTALSMMLHIKNLTVSCISHIAQQMQVLASNPDLLSLSAPDGSQRKQQQQQAAVGGGFVTPVKDGSSSGRTTTTTTTTTGAKAGKTPTSTTAGSATASGRQPPQQQQQQQIQSTPNMLDSPTDFGATMQFIYQPPNNNANTNPSPNNSNSEVDISSLRQAAHQLRSIVFIISPHPTLRRLLLSHGVEFVQLLSIAIQFTHICRIKLHQKFVSTDQQQQQSGNSSNTNNSREVLDIVLAVEEAVLGTLELIGQADISDSLLTVRQYQQFQQLHLSEHSDILSFVVPPIQHKCQFLDYIIADLLPTTAELTTHFDVDIRVITIATLRKLLPMLLRVILALRTSVTAFGLNEFLELQISKGTATIANTNNKKMLSLTNCILKPSVLFNCLYPKIANVLVDKAPIPQFGIRMLLDSFTIVSTAVAAIANNNNNINNNNNNNLYYFNLNNNANIQFEIAMELKKNDCLSQLIQLLKAAAIPVSSLQQQTQHSVASESLLGQTEENALTNSNHNNNSNHNSSSTNAQYEQDPQLVVLLRVLFDKTQSEQLLQPNVANISNSNNNSIIPMTMLEADLCNAVVTAIKSYVPIGSIVAFDVLLPLVELVYSILLFVFKVQSQLQAQQQQATRQQQQSFVEQVRRLGYPLRVLGSWFFGILLGHECRHNYVELPIWCPSSSASASNTNKSNSNHGYYHYNGENSDYSGEEGTGGSHGSTSMTQLIDLTTRCLGMLFDLFPDAIISQLLLTTSSQGFETELPKQIVAFSLLQPRMEVRSRLRLLKILLGTLRLAPELGVTSRVKDLLQGHDVLRPALIEIANNNRELIVDDTATEDDLANMSRFVEVARQVVLYEI